MSKKQSLIPKELSGAAKLAGIVQKALAKEFLTLIVVLAAAFPVALLVAYIMAHSAERDTGIVFQQILGQTNEGGGSTSFVIIYLISAAGLYFSRMIAGSIKVLVQKDPEE